jgi:mRNA-degrading endonuclease RelE of RelBE toxin-antitoxin system
MREYKLTKQAAKKLKKLAVSNPKLATQIADHVVDLRQDLIVGEPLSVYTTFKKIRVRDFRIIYTLVDEVLLIAIIDKRETVYQAFEHFYKNSDQFN